MYKSTSRQNNQLPEYSIHILNIELFPNDKSDGCNDRYVLFIIGKLVGDVWIVKRKLSAQSGGKSEVLCIVRKEGRRECNTSVYSDRRASNSQITGEQTKMFFYLIELSLLSSFAFFLLSFMIIFLLAR